MLDQAAENGYEAHHIRVRPYRERKRFLTRRAFAGANA
jgi:hypothetical protein